MHLGAAFIADFTATIVKNYIIPFVCYIKNRCNACFPKMLLCLQPLTCPFSIPANGDSHLKYLSAPLKVPL